MRSLKARLPVSLAGAAILLVAGCSSSPGTGGPPDLSLSQRDLNHADALAAYSKGLLLECRDTGDPDANRQAASDAFRQAAALDPGNSRPLQALVGNLAEEARYAEAFTHLQAFLERNPGSAELHVEAARLAEAAERPADAAHHCAAALALRPNERELALALVRLHFQAGQTGSALSAIRALQARFPDDQSAAVPISWAIHFTQEGKNPEHSLACLDLAIAQRTNAADRAALMLVAAENRLQLGETNVAETVLLDAYRLDPSANAAILRLGTVWAGRPDATNHLAALVRHGHDPLVTPLILAATCQALGDAAAAAATLDDFHARRLRDSYFPDKNFYLWFASLLESTQQRPRVESVLSTALIAHPASHEIKNFLAYMWAEQAVRLDEADRLINDALADAPGNAAYLDTKGWVLFKKGRFYDALQFLLKAAELDKDEPEILDHVGDALFAAGYKNEAAAFWTRAHELAPSPAIAEKLKGKR